ncbi:MAG: class I SAM-dependent methyltransferase [Polyangiaceae bacterium]
MDRARVWPHFEEAWILHEDDDILVVNKPDGVPTQAADPERPDDLLTRLRAARGKHEYYGIHQRLDRDTSGALVLTRRKEANARLSAQFEGRGVEKRYLAAVEGWPRGKESAVLRDYLAPGEDGRMQVVPARGKRGKEAKEAITRVRVVSRQEGRALLELVLETGRTHQARVQLAHAGAPIAGDPLYRGPRAPRLLLHARSLAFAHPSSGTHVTFEAPAPPELEAWLRDGDAGERIYDNASGLERALARAMRRRYGLGHSAHDAERATTCFRVVNEAGDSLPKLAVDLYGNHLVAQLYSDAAGEDLWADAARRARVLDQLLALGVDGVYLKVRPKQANTLVDTRRADLAPSEPVRGVPAADPLLVREEGVELIVRLGDGLSTGLFLDQRANRRRVREIAGGSSVVNLFAYTCAFSAAAARGGAWRTISVDASAAALERGRDNLRAAGVLDAAEHLFVAEDAFAWLAAAARRRERHDLVILDPPSYSTTKKHRFVAESDYADLAALAIAIIRPGGKLLACVNHRGISPAKFRRAIFDAGRAAKVELAQVKDLPTPGDFPLAPGESSHLKSVLATLAR